jgi:hypothetical protein
MHELAASQPAGHWHTPLQQSGHEGGVARQHVDRGQDSIAGGFTLGPEQL